MHLERIGREVLPIRYSCLAALPLGVPDRGAMIDAFAKDVKLLGITGLFERRELNASMALLKERCYAGPREKVPYAVCRL